MLNTHIVRIICALVRANGRMAQSWAEPWRSLLIQLLHPCSQLAWL